MKNFAEFQILGRVSQEAKKVGSAVKLSIAANYPRKNEAGKYDDEPYYNQITIFGKSDQTYALEHISKGDLVVARGVLRQNQYKNSAGETIYSVDLICNEFSRLAKPADHNDD